MKMAYSKAWSIMKNSENSLGVRLLLSSTGGVEGGGAAASAEGDGEQVSGDAVSGAED